MPVDPAATPLDTHQLALEQDRDRKAWLARAEADVRRHQAAAAALAEGSARLWSSATPALAVLCVIVAPASVGLYAWAFDWLPLGPVPAVVPAIMLGALLVNVGLADGNATSGAAEARSVDPGRLVMAAALMATSCLLMAWSGRESPVDERAWLGLVGLLAAGCLIALPRHLVAAVARRRAMGHQRRADQAREDIAYLSVPFTSPVTGTVVRGTTE